MGLVIIFGILFGFGLYKLLAHACKIPLLQTQKAVMNVGKNSKSLTSIIEAFLMDLAVKLGKFIPIDKYKRIRLESTLKSADIRMTPEVYIAYAIMKALFVMCFSLLVLPVFPVLVPVIGVFAIRTFFNESGKADRMLKAKREAIEDELPRFVATVEQELHSSRDILSILENFKRTASHEFGYELDVTCADMRSSSYEAALTRFEARIGSPQLSDVVRGLISVLRGDDSAVYFKMLAHDFKLAELQRLKAKALKIPGKIRTFSFMLLGVFLLTYLVVMGMQIIDSLGVMML